MIPNLENYFQADFKNGITIQLSYRNNVEIWCCVDGKIQYLDERSRKNYFLKLNFYTLLTTQINFVKQYIETSFHVNFKNGIRIKLLCRNNGELWC